jgi:hypothetical protein
MAKKSTGVPKGVLLTPQPTTSQYASATSAHERQAQQVVLQQRQAQQQQQQQQQQQHHLQSSASSSASRRSSSPVQPKLSVARSDARQQEERNQVSESLLCSVSVA